MKENEKSYRNPTLIRYHPSCRLCSYAGFSNVCNFSRTGKCAYNISSEDTGANEEVERDD